MAGLAGLPMREGDSGYGEVDLSTGGAGASEGQESLDHEVQLNVDEEPYTSGTIAAPAPAASAAAMSSKGKRVKSPAYDEAEESASYSAPADEESTSRSAPHAAAGYAQQDEYDDDEYDDRR